jgi:hypothetical protein
VLVAGALISILSKLLPRRKTGNEEAVYATTPDSKATYNTHLRNFVMTAAMRPVRTVRCMLEAY